LEDHPAINVAYTFKAVTQKNNNKPQDTLLKHKELGYKCHNSKAKDNLNPGANQNKNRFLLKGITLSLTNNLIASANG